MSRGPRDVKISRCIYCDKMQPGPGPARDAHLRECKARKRWLKLMADTTQPSEEE